MKILVTGAAGFIGSHVVAKLLEQGHEVMGVDSFDIYYSRSQKEKNLMPVLLHPKFKLVEDNLADMALVKVVKGTEAIVHLAAQPGVRGSWGSSFHRYITNNIQVTQKLLEESKANKLKRFVYASSSSVYGDHAPQEGQDVAVLHEEMICKPRSPYGVTKLAAEKLVQLYHQEYKMPTVSLRFFSVYGPGQRPDMAFNRFCHSILHDAALTVYGDGKQVRDFTFVDDVVEVIAAAVTSETAVGEVVNVGGGSPCTLMEAVTMLEEISGKTCPKTFLERQKGDVFSTRADTAKLERIFGVKPKTPLREGLVKQWEWMQKFVQAEDEEQAIKAQVQPITGVDEAVLAEAKADEKATKKAARKAEKATKAAKAKPGTTEA
ncbi:MAG TPA: NAD-dependent epimerase/dehydratase family protein [Puia sp.]|nr:NAD-dependent epimerase/dehydratase family protein [Puia sp.]